MEASYFTRVTLAGHPGEQSFLLTYKTPLRFDCRKGLNVDTASIREKAALAAAFVRHGILHILTGYDHLLFVAALLLAVTTFWDLVKVISAFTLAHTLTLALAALDIFRLPGRIVEPMIAASIIFVALQNVFWPERSRGWSRLVVAFVFGLFHGLGFAGGLLDAMSQMYAGGPSSRLPHLASASKSVTRWWYYLSLRCGSSVACGGKSYLTIVSRNAMDQPRFRSREWYFSSQPCARWRLGNRREERLIS